MPKNIELSAIDTFAPKSITKEEAKKQLDSFKEELVELQNVLYAQKKYSLLVVLQGLDGSGKDGAIKNVFNGMNPMGVDVASFKRPTEEELAHDFLWRVHAKTPAKGMIVIFNRSHYEDVLVPCAHKTIDAKETKKRFDNINDFEKLLTGQNTIILKFYLHISKDEQLKTLEERKENPKKMWKNEDADMNERQLWNEYMAAYEDIFKNCNDIPWEIVPSDNNWYKEYVIGKKVLETLKGLDLEYPGLKK